MRSIYRSRLKTDLDEGSEEFISSLKSDKQLLQYEIDSSLAHAIVLQEQKILTNEQALKLISALESLRKQEIPARGFEDIHEYVESAVTKIAGHDVGGRLHTARSRNDQVATVTRMFCRERLLELGDTMLRLAGTLSRLSEKHAKDPVLSYTHLQQAQVQTLGHHLQSYLASVLRTLERLSECYRRTNLSPLGASAGAGSTIRVDRERTAELLGFDGLLENCQDAVQSRDYAVEAAFIQCLVMLDLSRVAEDLILWSTSEFHYFELPDSLSSPSSVMPHKKNADLLELVRATTAAQIAKLLEMQTILKGLPSGYNRDLQNLKEVLLHSFPPIVESITTTEKCLRLGSFNTEEMKERATNSAAFVLPLAEWMVLNKSVSFREAHKIAGRIIAKSDGTSISVAEISNSKLHQMLKEAGGPRLNAKELRELKLRLSLHAVLKATRTEGGPSLTQVMRTHSLLNREIKRVSRYLSIARGRLRTARDNLQIAKRRLVSA